MRLDFRETIVAAVGVGGAELGGERDGGEKEAGASEEIREYGVQTGDAGRLPGSALLSSE